MRFKRKFNLSQLVEPWERNFIRIGMINMKVIGMINVVQEEI